MTIGQIPCSLFSFCSVCMAVGAFFDKKHVCRHELWEKTLSLHQIAFPCMNAGLAGMTSVLEQIASVGGPLGIIKNKQKKET